MSTRFTPGELTGPQAAALNEMARVGEQFSRLTVAPPLSLTRPAGIPAIRLDTTTLTGDVLAESTANNGAIPPVHTAKRKTRDTSNFVVDYSPLETFTQVLNPQETAWANGTLIELVKIPDWPGWYWGFAVGGGVVPPTLPCEPHGWLLDRQALIDTHKYFDVQVFAGAGRCACIMDQGRTPGSFPYPWQAKYNATADKWLLMEKIATCCDDCVQLKLDVNETTGIMTGQLVGTTACDASGAFTYDLVTMCSGRGYVIFGAAGPKLCNTTLVSTCADDLCDNAFLFLVTCDCCDNANITCDRCCTCTGSPFVLFNLTGFGGANAFLNALWVLPYQGSCTWGFTCNGVTFAYAITYDGVNTTHLTFTISGIATYEYDIVAGDTQISCFVNRTLTRTSGDAGTTPGTVLMEPFTCDTTPSACFKGVSTSDLLYFQFHDCTGAAACLNGLVVTLTYGVGSCAGTGLSSWQGTFPDCTDGATPGDICITCNTGGADNTCPLVMNINFMDMGCTGPFTIVSWTCDPFVLEVQYVDTCFFGILKGRFTTTHP